MSRLDTPATTLTEAQEAALLARLRHGDEAAFEELVRAYGPRLLAVARRMMGNDADAEDALQDGFLSAFKSLHTFEGGSKLSTWLHRVVVNAALMRLRAARSRPSVPIDDPMPRFGEDGHSREIPAVWNVPPESRIQDQELVDIVRRAIDELPEAHRVVLVMRDIAQIDTAGTAELLGIAEGAVKTRLHRARQALRELLDRKFRG